jgi:hypothetical protein
LYVLVAVLCLDTFVLFLFSWVAAQHVAHLLLLPSGKLVTGACFVLFVVMFVVMTSCRSCGAASCTTT